MIEFEIKDFELGGHKTKVTAQGIAEAMLDYLPWPTLEITIHWLPCDGIYTITDLKTDFKYEVKT